MKTFKTPFLPAKYYIGILNKFSSFSNLGKHFIENLFTVLRTDYFSEEEKQAIQESLDHNGFSNSYQVDTQIVFDGNESEEDLYEKIKYAYFNGQEVPISIALNVFNNALSGLFPIDFQTLQGCTHSIISALLDSMGITEKYQIFFGESSTDGGKLSSNPNYIMINSALLSSFITNPSLESAGSLFSNSFHESNHAFQDSTISNGNLDFLEYNWLLELIALKIYPFFYKEDYERIFIESDSRKEAILGNFSIINSINPQLASVIRESLEKAYLTEATTYSISKDSEKTITIAEGITITITVSDYVGYLIKDDPTILSDNPILNIGYNQDGSQKSIETLLQEFEQGAYSQGLDSSNIYSIYDGLISQRLPNLEIADEELQEKIHHFKSLAPCAAPMKAIQAMAESVSLEDIQALFDRVQNYSLFPKTSPKGKEDDSRDSLE